MNDQFETRCQQTRIGLAITTSTSKLGKLSLGDPVGYDRWLDDAEGAATSANGAAAKLAVDPREARAQPPIRPIGAYIISP